MKVTEMEAELYCIHCLDDTPHVITYINNKISKIECECCHHIVEIKIDLMEEFYNELFKRIASKPLRITQEYKKDLSRFLFSLPIRVVSKPYRLYKEVKEAKKYMKKYNMYKPDKGNGTYS